MRSRTRHQGGQTRQEVEWLKQALRRPVAKWAFEFVHNQTVAIDRQLSLDNGPRAM